MTFWQKLKTSEHGLRPCFWVFYFFSALWLTQSMQLLALSTGAFGGGYILESFCSRHHAGPAGFGLATSVSKI